MIKPYNREKAVEYAHQWALGRNPQFYDFSGIGGDCTNFASQVLFAGSGVMNYSRENGWYYINVNSRSPSWTDVDLLYRFLITNKLRGPFGREVPVELIMPGDIVQLSFVGNDDFNHTPVVVATGTPPSINNILVATHSADHDNYPLSRFRWQQIRFIHILGVYD